MARAHAEQVIIGWKCMQEMFALAFTEINVSSGVNGIVNGKICESNTVKSWNRAHNLDEGLEFD